MAIQGKVVAEFSRVKEPETQKPAPPKPETVKEQEKPDKKE